MNTVFEKKNINYAEHSKNKPILIEVKTGEERNLVTFKGNPMNNYIIGELSTRLFHSCGC